MRTITYQEAYDALKETVEANPDRQVKECRYVDRDNRPNCVVGVVLDKLGVPLPEYRAIANTASIDSSPVRSFLDIQEVALAIAATDLLDRAQTIQDSAADGTGSPAEPDRPGRPWRDILTELL
jgi:hypothetical protein